MPLTTLNLSTSLVLNATYDHLVLQDTTGLYNIVTNPFGYGSPGGIAVNNVTGLVITLNYTAVGIAVVYTFTISSGTITAATINFNGIAPINILSQLTSTVFPFTSANPFVLFNNYISTGPVTITLPAIEDGAYSTVYKITGTASATPFDLSTTKMVLQSAATDCCINEAFSKVPVDCDCEDANLTAAMRSKAYEFIAQLAVADSVQDAARANSFINKAKTLCNCGCGCT